MMRRHAVVRCAWDADAAVWTVTQSDIPGLCTEAETLDGLRGKLPGMIRDLMEEGQIGEIEVDLIAYSHDRVTVGAA